MRGGLLDIFPVQEPHPTRIELFGEQIESLRAFSVTSQRSLSQHQTLTVPPANIIIRNDENLSDQTQLLFDQLVLQDITNHERNGIAEAFREGHNLSILDLFGPVFFGSNNNFFDYLSKDTTFFFPEGIAPCVSQLDSFLEAKQTQHQQDLEDKKPSLDPRKHFAHNHKVFERISSNYKVLECGNPETRKEAYVLKFQNSSPRRSFIPNTKLDFHHWIQTIRGILDEGGNVTILTREPASVERISNLLSYQNIAQSYAPEGLNQLPFVKNQQHVTIAIGEISEKIWDYEYNSLIINDYELLGKAAPSPNKRKKLSGKKTHLADLKKNDLVVHIKHGIGKYLGIVNLTISNASNDFLSLEYQGGDKIYVPVNNVDQLQKYVIKDGDQKSLLDKLGGRSWQNKKQRVEKSLQEIADDLIRIHAAREAAKGPVFHQASDLYYQLVDDFPFTETEDQIKSLEEIEADFTSGKIMDRLLVGDVGFGKTEVAIRATMRVVLQGQQVLILVPTTVLCYQQFKVFSDRLGKYGVEVEQINRFVETKKQKKILQRITDGTVDVVIGTHRLLSKDIKPAKLGLIVVDEEQRFGVVHKEKLKRLQTNANVLTLSATPIPRTLHLAMVGIRDISILATPPVNRIPIRTIVTKFDETIIKSSILAERHRGGQVFFLHNRVEELGEINKLINKVVPSASVATAHGQMKESQLEQTFLDFLNQRFQILVCTTIIESGIDLPNVNTLIVNRAERFGLSQLYQIRGRVGRSSTQAYAFFLCDTEKSSDTARKRLEILASHQNLGSGFQIAQYDMEIRGVGDLLGRSQSGHISAVGFDLYLDMLNDAIHSHNKEKNKPTEISPEIRLNLSASIDASFIHSEQDRLEVYNNIFSSTDDGELAQIKSDVEDRYGQLPEKLELNWHRSTKDSTKPYLQQSNRSDGK